MDTNTWMILPTNFYQWLYKFIYRCISVDNIKINNNKNLILILIIRIIILIILIIILITLIKILRILLILIKSLVT